MFDSVLQCLRYVLYFLANNLGDTYLILSDSSLEGGGTYERVFCVCSRSYLLERT